MTFSSDQERPRPGGNVVHNEYSSKADVGVDMFVMLEDDDTGPSTVDVLGTSS